MDIIKFPKCVNNYSSLWSVYEKSYKNRNYLYEYHLDNSDVNNYINEFSKILKIKNIFYNKEEDVVLKELFTKLNNKFVNKYNDEFISNITTFIESEKMNDFMRCFLITLRYDTERISLVVDHFSKYNFINDIKKIDQILTEIKKLNKMDEVINMIYILISKDICDRFIKFIESVEIDVLSNLLKKINLFKKFYNNFNFILKSSVNHVILNKVVKKLDNSAISNIKMANNVISLFNFLLTEEYTITSVISEIDTTLLIDYLSASIYFWILENNYYNIEILILYCYNYLPRLDFLEYYKIHLQNRVLFLRNYEIENKCFNKISEVFVDEEFNTIIYDLRYIIDDIYISNLCNNELSNLNVNVKYNFKETEFDLSKCNILVCSNNLWNTGKNLYNSINYNDNIAVYDCMINKFYERKYSKKRKISISYEESIINIKFCKNSLIMPLSYYNIFYKIGETDKSCTFNYLKENLNYDNDYLLNIINIFKSKNLIKEIIVIENDKLKNYINSYYENGNFDILSNISFSSVGELLSVEELYNIVLNYIHLENLKLEDNVYKLDKNLIEILNVKEDVVYVINENLENEELKINLTCIGINKKKIKEKIEYDRNLLLDSKICSLLKKEKELKYGKLLLLFRNIIGKFFIPSEKEILSRLERLNILGYIEKSEDMYKYIE